MINVQPWNLGCQLGGLCKWDAGFMLVDWITSNAKNYGTVFIRLPLHRFQWPHLSKKVFTCTFYSCFFLHWLLLDYSVSSCHSGSLMSLCVVGLDWFLRKNCFDMSWASHPAWDKFRHGEFVCILALKNHVHCRLKCQLIDSIYGILRGSVDDLDPGETSGQ